MFDYQIERYLAILYLMDKITKQQIENYLKGDKKMKPSDFTNYPWDSVTKKSEVEVVARNIMIILKRTGDKFLNLSWDEYRKELTKDDQVPDRKMYFDKAIKYCQSPKTAKSFSPEWNKKVVDKITLMRGSVEEGIE